MRDPKQQHREQVFLWLALSFFFGIVVLKLVNG